MIEELKQLIDQISPALLNALWHIIVAIIIFFVGRRLINALMRKIEAVDIRSHIDTGLRKFLLSLFKAGLWALLIYLVAYFLGIPTATFVALFGTIGVTVGLALQGSLSNFAGGVLLLFLHPFRVGDYVKVSDEFQGTVVDIGLFYTSINTMDNRVITVPNGTLSNGNIINYSARPTRRIDLSVGISYSADMDKAIEVLTAMLRNREKTVRKEDAIVFVEKLDSSSVNLGVRYWVDRENYSKELWSINHDIKETLDQNDIAIPFNQLDVHVIEP